MILLLGINWYRLGYKLSIACQTLLESGGFLGCFWPQSCPKIHYRDSYDVISSIPRVNNQLWLDLPIQILVLAHHFKTKRFTKIILDPSSRWDILSIQTNPLPNLSRVISRANLILELIPSRAVISNRAFLGLENVRQLIIIIGQFRQNQIIIFQLGESRGMKFLWKTIIFNRINIKTELFFQLRSMLSKYIYRHKIQYESYLGVLRLAPRISILAKFRQKNSERRTPLYS